VSPLRILTLCLLFLLLSGLGAGVRADAASLPVAQLESGRNRIELSPHMSYTVDMDGRADYVAMFSQAGLGQFQPLPDKRSTFGFSNGTYWFHARLFNKDSFDERWLLVLQYPLLDEISVYLRYPDGRVEFMSSGDSMPFSSRAIRYRMPNFWISLPQRTEVELLVSARSKSSMQVPLALYTAAAFAEMERDAQFGIGLYNGILLALFFYNFVLWLSLRDGGHFWYMCHIAGFGLVLFCLNGLAFEYLWPNSPWMANLAIPLSMCLSMVSMHQFARTFLQTRQRWPAGDRVSQGFIAYYVVLGLASLVIDYRVSVQLGTYGVFPGVLFILYTAFQALRKGYQPARLFLTAWTALLLGTTMYALVSFGLLPKNFVTEYGIQIGSALEMILLSFALAYRYASLREENERIVREANERLEINVSRRTAELSSALEQLADVNTRLRESARRDALTGLFNRRHFHEVLEHLLEQSAELRQPLGLLLVDLDHFKKINDTHGHLAGDECLRQLAVFLNETLAGQTAVCARFGGEEFAIVVSNLSPARVQELAERLRQRICTEPVNYAGKQILMSASIGVFNPPPGVHMHPDQAVHHADDALYAAKNAGRNRVVVANPMA
jgi:diguanylate cyclase (GGDEF)-like protein